MLPETRNHPKPTTPQSTRSSSSFATAVTMTLYYTLVRGVDACLVLESFQCSPWRSITALTAPNLQVFMLLMAEMALFMFLILPMPFSLKRRVFTYVPLASILKAPMGRTGD